MNKDKILTIVENEIVNWDPVALIKMGAPKNEYDIEINMITRNIKSNYSIVEISKVIYEVLIEMFEKDSFEDICRLKEECYDIAQKIYKKIMENEN